MKPQSNVSQTFLIADPFWFRKITTDPHFLAHVRIECPYDMHPKFKMYISELILDRFFAYCVGRGSFLIRYSKDHTK